MNTKHDMVLLLFCWSRPIQGVGVFPMMCFLFLSGRGCYNDVIREELCLVSIEGCQFIGFYFELPLVMVSLQHSDAITKVGRRSKTTFKGQQKCRTNDTANHSNDMFCHFLCRAMLFTSNVRFLGQLGRCVFCAC